MVEIGKIYKFKNIYMVNSFKDKLLARCDLLEGMTTDHIGRGIKFRVIKMDRNDYLNSTVKVMDIF